MADIIRALEQIVGADYVTAEPDLRVGDKKPTLLVRPGAAAEAAQCLKACADAGAAVIPAGLMSWLAGGNPVRRADVVLSLERMNRIVEYSPADLTASVEAGLSLDAFNAATRDQQQWLPLDPAGSSRSSLGAVAACGSTGALRLGLGAPRGFVIGLTHSHILLC